MTMHAAKRKKLEAAGWTSGSVTDFLGLSPVEEAVIEMKLSLANAMKKLRESNRLSQEALAKQLGSSQSRVAKMESGDPTVSIDLIVRSMVTLGASPTQIAKALAPRATRAKAPATARKKAAAKKAPARKVAAKVAAKRKARASGPRAVA
jgi:transcriptional regulator with XRE-family HTH domain